MMQKPSVAARPGYHSELGPFLSVRVTLEEKYHECLARKEQDPEVDCSAYETELEQENTQSP